MVKAQSSKFKQRKRRMVQVRDEQEGRQSSFRPFSRRIKETPAEEDIIQQTKRTSSWRKSSRLQKVRKTLKRMKVVVAEKRGETRLLKELLKEEATALGNKVEKFRSDIEKMKRENEVKLEKDECIRQFIYHMLGYL